MAQVVNRGTSQPDTVQRRRPPAGVHARPWPASPKITKPADSTSTAKQYPALHRAIAAGAFDDDEDPDAYFNYGLGRILDGVGRLAAGSEAPPPQTRRPSSAPTRPRRGRGPR